LKLTDGLLVCFEPHATVFHGLTILLCYATANLIDWNTKSRLNLLQ